MLLLGFTFAVSDAVSTFFSSMLDLAWDVFDISRFEVAAPLLVRFFLCGVSLSFAAVSASAFGGSEGCEYLSFSLCNFSHDFHKEIEVIESHA